MTDRTPSQVNESLDNAWALIRELQDAQRAIARTSDDLCLRVSQNHKALCNMMGDTRTDLLNADGRSRIMSQRIEKLEAKVGQIDAVLDHDTDSMLLSNLCKRVADLELRERNPMNTLVCDQQARKMAIDVANRVSSLELIAYTKRVNDDFVAADKRAAGAQMIGVLPRHAVSSEGVAHNFNSADSLGPATVTLDPLADPRGLSVCIDGHHMRGHFLIIPWEAIDKKRLEAVKAKCSPIGDTFHAAPWWKP